MRIPLYCRIDSLDYALTASGDSNVQFTKLFKLAHFLSIIQSLMAFG